ncbi:hypothetical protein Cadr_000015444 [Camelus dromedarius]|uniref:Uncharacterized protein n=1 Tax=Camelus dromedarius TaxID=9838 RepID=A0A5N4DMF1_CAMDR|nr:hypothetical protein Cadr_000015444 [Camelus dromedarius]
MNRGGSSPSAAANYCSVPTAGKCCGSREVWEKQQKEGTRIRRKRSINVDTDNQIVSVKEKNTTTVDRR